MSVTFSPSVVVVGVDGSTSSRHAAQWASRYAAMTGSRVRLVVAWNWVMSFGYPQLMEELRPEAHAKQLAEESIAAIDLPKDRVEVRVEQGDPREVLVKDSADAALLVVGSRGLGRFEGPLLGSVSAYCIAHASVPVVVTR